ncbi:MAG TPA: c-type cytochrome [Anaeromyxobacteraceae bacterium]|nr:c-type cytochrome [Anaeromyxobacteraceae bacterium]
MTKRWLVVLIGAAAVAACSGPQLPRTASGPAVLAVRGQVKHGPFALGRADLAQLPRAGFRAVDPATGKEARYDGVALQPLVYQKLERIDGADTVLIVTASKQAVPISPVILRQFKPILADTIDGQPAPLQVAWPNVEQQGIARDARAASWWAHDVEAIELVAWDKTWGKALRTPPGSSDAARLGAGQYALRCASCHRLNGAGGQAGPALDGATGRLGLSRFVAAVRAHPAWQDRIGTELAAGDDVAGQVASFLSTVEASGPLPPEEPLTPPSRGARAP